MFYMIYAWTGNCADLLCTAQNVHVMAWVFRYFLFYLIDYNIVPCVTLHFLSLSLLLPLFLLTCLHHTLCILESVFPSFFVGSFVFLVCSPVLCSPHVFPPLPPVFLLSPWFVPDLFVFCLGFQLFARFLLPAFCFVEFSCILLKLAFCFSTCLSLCVWMPFWPCLTLSNRHLSTLVDTQISVSVLWAHWLCILNMNPAECNRLRCILLRWTT